MDDMRVPAPVSSAYLVPSSSSAQLVIGRDRKSCGRDEFTIRDSFGHLLFEVVSKLLSVHTNGVLQEPSGKPVVYMEAKFMTWRHRWKAYRGNKKSNSNYLFLLTRKEKPGFPPLYEVFLPNNHSKTSDFTIKGNLLQKSFIISYGDVPIAETRGSEGYYEVTIDPTVDQAFVVALIFILDEVSLYDLGDVNGVDYGVTAGGGAG